MWWKTKKEKQDNNFNLQKTIHPSIERSQLRWFGHMTRMPPWHFLCEVFQAYPIGRRPWGRTRTRWRDYIFQPSLERVGVSLNKLEVRAGAAAPVTQLWTRRRKWMDGQMNWHLYLRLIKLIYFVLMSFRDSRTATPIWKALCTRPHWEKVSNKITFMCSTEFSFSFLQSLRPSTDVSVWIQIWLLKRTVLILLTSWSVV